MTPASAPSWRIRTSVRAFACASPGKIVRSIPSGTRIFPRWNFHWCCLLLSNTVSLSKRSGSRARCWIALFLLRILLLRDLRIFIFSLSGLAAALTSNFGRCLGMRFFSFTRVAEAPAILLPFQISSVFWSCTTKFFWIARPSIWTYRQKQNF